MSEFLFKMENHLYYIYIYLLITRVQEKLRHTLFSEDHFLHTPNSRSGSREEMSTALNERALEKSAKRVQLLGNEEKLLLKVMCMAESKKMVKRCLRRLLTMRL